MAFTLLAPAGAGFLSGLQGAWLVFMLGILENSLSFDNAVVNASVLTNWVPICRRRFMVWGLPAAVLGVTSFMPQQEQLTFLVAGLWGLITYVGVDAIGTLMGGAEGVGAKRIVKEGLGGFLYLEVLDTSFSFDGVIGAFALSTQVFTIALGLGVGSVFARAMTLHLVDKGTLTALRYLEHGAFWSIGALASIMLVSSQVEIPESITGLIGAVSVGLAVWSFVRANRKECLDGPDAN